jgi:dephospho-CoA kinase
LDAPLLLETNFEPLVDKIVFIDCPREKRLARALERGWTEEHFDAREKAQLPLETKRQRADFVIDNSGSLRDTSKEIKRCLNEIFC